eukprot:7386685-Prymnesium_polylepis.1
MSNLLRAYLATDCRGAHHGAVSHMKHRTGVYYHGNGRIRGGSVQVCATHASRTTGRAVVMRTMQAVLLLCASITAMGDIPSNASAIAEAQTQAMRERESESDQRWHNVPETADEVEHEAMGVYTKIDPVGDHDELYAMGEGHDRKTLFSMTFAPRSDGGMGDAVGPPAKHWLIGEIPSAEGIDHVHGVEELTVEIIGPAVVSPRVATDACGDLVHAHTVEGWKFLDEVKAAVDDVADSDLDASAVMATPR